MAVVLAKCNPPKGASRLSYTSSPPRMPLEVFYPAPLWHPPILIEHLSSAETTRKILAHGSILFRRVTRCPQAALASIAGFRSSDKHSD